MNAPMIKLAGLYEKTSGKGNRYFVGRLNGARLLMFTNTEKQARVTQTGISACKNGKKRAERLNPLRRSRRQATLAASVEETTQHGEPQGK